MAEKSDNHGETAEGDFGLGAFRHRPEEAGISLDQLGEALAGMLRTGDDPYAPPAGQQAGDVEIQDTAAGDSSPRDADNACEVTPRSILEAMLFVGHPHNEPLTSKQVAGWMRGVRPAEIDTLVRELNRDYAARNCPYTIVASGVGYGMALREEYARLRDTLHGKARRARLSQAAIEVLAAVAYNQPIAAEDVSRLRGMPSGHTLLQLVRRQLLRVERGDEKPRCSQYYTTNRFLELFGLASLDDLPRSHDLEEA